MGHLVAFPWSVPLHAYLIYLVSLCMVSHGSHMVQVDHQAPTSHPHPSVFHKLYNVCILVV